MHGETPAAVIENTAGLQAVYRTQNVRLAVVTIQFQLAHPAVAVVIPGARTPDEATEAQRLLNVRVHAAIQLRASTWSMSSCRAVCTDASIGFAPS